MVSPGLLPQQVPRFETFPSTSSYLITGIGYSAFLKSQCFFRARMWGASLNGPACRPVLKPYWKRFANV